MVKHLPESSPVTALAQVTASLFILALLGCSSNPDPPVLSKEVIFPHPKLDQPFSKALGDLDGDGFLDAVVGDYRNKIYWYHYPKWEARVVSESNGGDDLAVADIDGDGDADLVSNGGKIAWYENPGNAASGDTALRWTEHVIQYSIVAHDVVAGDIDGDGRMDVGARVENGPTFVFRQTAPGVWAQVTAWPRSEGVGTAWADVDGDGRIDVVGSGYYLKQPADPATAPWPKVEITPWPGASAVAVKDIDGDGRPDVFLAGAYQPYKLSWFSRAESDTAWTEHIVSDVLSHVHRFHLVDVDADGDLDVVFAEQHQSASHRVGGLLNLDGKGGSWSMQLYSTKGAHNIAVGDIGNDGVWDMLAVNWSGDTRIRLLLNLGKNPKENPLGASPLAAE